jgi:hypothetical protein
LRGLRGLFIAVWILAAASMAIIRSLTSPDGADRVISRFGVDEKHVRLPQAERTDLVVQSKPPSNNVTATSTPTDETARLKTNLLPTSHRVHGGASIKTGSTKVVRNVPPGAHERYTPTASASTKRKRGAVRSRIHVQAAPHDHYRVYDGGHRVGADPDLNIRRTLGRQHTWLN